MDKSIWVFFNPLDLEKNIFVIGVSSVLAQSQLICELQSDSSKHWYVRKKEWQKALSVQEFLEIHENSNKNEISALSEESPQKTPNAIEENKTLSIETEEAEKKLNEAQLETAEPAPSPQPTMPLHEESTSPVIELKEFQNKAPQVKEVISEKEQAFIDRRKHPRYKIRFKLLVMANKRIFRTYTNDISLGGVLLEKEIPKDLKGERCKLIISNENSTENIETFGVFAENSKGTDRIQFLEENSEKFQEILTNWMASLQEKAA